MTEHSTMTLDTYGNKYWKNSVGDYHREDGPAIEWIIGSKAWYINGQRHREDGPAVEYPDGTKEWWVNGKMVYQEEPND